jgi:hypothetical protein
VGHTTIRALARSFLAGFFLTTHAGVALAAPPMDLGDPRPRFVSVRFETSPADQPGRLASFYTEAIPARLSPGDFDGQVRVTIASSDFEAQVMHNQRPRPGSFSDFVWLFDAASGEVVSARLRGTLVRRFEFGLFVSTSTSTSRRR